jgi:hypothetical protein
VFWLLPANVKHRFPRQLKRKQPRTKEKPWDMTLSAPLLERESLKPAKRLKTAHHLRAVVVLVALVVRGEGSAVILDGRWPVIHSGSLYGPERRGASDESTALVQVGLAALLLFGTAGRGADLIEAPCSTLTYKTARGDCVPCTTCTPGMSLLTPCSATANAVCTGWRLEGGVGGFDASDPTFDAPVPAEFEQRKRDWLRSFHMPQFAASWQTDSALYTFGGSSSALENQAYMYQSLADNTYSDQMDQIRFRSDAHLQIILDRQILDRQIHADKPGMTDEMWKLELSSSSRWQSLGGGSIHRRRLQVSRAGRGRFLGIRAYQKLFLGPKNCSLY